MRHSIHIYYSHYNLDLERGSLRDQFGIPAPVYVAPVYVAPVYVPPPPPVVYQQPVYVASAPVIVAAVPAVVIGWHGDRYWDGYCYWNRRDWYMRTTAVIAAGKRRMSVCNRGVGIRI
ncbi:putative signal peptide protein [Candidatus Burkholderia brachyanthoides]|nr:putative signal peptide protein [Candidatus Burkholderia brachyanthoides]